MILLHPRIFLETYLYFHYFIHIFYILVPILNIFTVLTSQTNNFVKQDPLFSSTVPCNFWIFSSTFLVFPHLLCFLALSRTFCSTNSVQFILSLFPALWDCSAFHFVAVNVLSHRSFKISSVFSVLYCQYMKCYNCSRLFIMKPKSDQSIKLYI